MFSKQDSGGRASVLVASTLVLAALLALGVPEVAEGVGLPQITFVSQGGIVSGDYVLQVTVTGDLAAGEVYYGVDVADPQTQMLFAGGDTYQAVIDTTIYVEGDHSLLVKAINTTGSHAQVSQVITVDRTVPTIELHSAGGLWTGTVNVTATVTDAHLDPSAVKVVVDMNEDDPIPMTGEGDSFWVELDTSGLTEDDHQLYVTALDLAVPPNKGTSATLDFFIDNTAPEIEVTSTVPDYVMGDYVVTVTVTDAHLNTSAVWLFLDDNMSDPRNMTDEGTHWEYVINTLTEWMCGPHVFKVMAIDLADLVTVTDNVTLQVDNCPPEVSFDSSGGHVKGVYELRVNVTDAYLDPASVWAVFDGDVLNKTALVQGAGGLFTYTFDSATRTDGDHTVYVIATDLAGLTRESDDLVLMVDNNPPRSSITSEGGNVSAYLDITATVEDEYLDEDMVYLIVDGDEDNTIELVWNGEEWEATIDTRMYDDGEHTLRVWAFDMWGQSAKSEGLYIDVDNNIPYIMILSGGGEQWGNYVLRANVTDPHLNTSCVKAKVGDAEPVQMSFNGEEWRYTVNTLDLPNGPITIMVMACDYRGNMNPGMMVEITVENRADLEIVSVEWVKTEVEEGSTIKVKVTVTNNGHSTANQFDVALVSGGKTLDNATEVTGLQPGKEHTFTLSWKAKGTGTKNVQVKVDTGNSVEEIDDTNNSWEMQQIKVVEESPGFGLALAALALLGAALVGRRRR